MAHEWYVIQTLSGQEQKVEKSLAKRIGDEEMGEYIKEVLVPMEKVVEVRAGKKTTTQRKLYHGYMFMEVNLYDEEGRIHAVDATYAARCGFSSDLSGPVTDRALFHADSSYFYPHVHLTSRPLKTHTVSNTAFRGFGGPQGMLAIENIIEEIANRLSMACQWLVNCLFMAC